MQRAGDYWDKWQGTTQFVHASLSRSPDGQSGGRFRGKTWQPQHRLVGDACGTWIKSQWIGVAWGQKKSCVRTWWRALNRFPRQCLISNFIYLFTNLLRHGHINMHMYEHCGPREVCCCHIWKFYEFASHYTSTVHLSSSPPQQPGRGMNRAALLFCLSRSHCVGTKRRSRQLAP